jgi:hypothetical protein
MVNEVAIDLPFWKGLLRAVEAEPVELNSILAGSGIAHALLAAGVDAGRRRLVVISGNKNPRTAALALADLQASFRAVQIVMLRYADREPATDRQAQTDTDLGVGWLSASDFSATERSVIAGGERDDVRRLLAEHQLLQYFFPAPDHLALGLIEQSRFATIPQAVDQLVRAPDLGHPFGPPEIVREYGSFTDMITEMIRLGFVHADANGLALTEAGMDLRATVRGYAREAMVSKVLNRMKASLNFKPIWLPVIRRQH